MSVCAPFAVSSKCVMRSENDPSVVNETENDVTENDQLADASANTGTDVSLTATATPSEKSSSRYIISDGRAESGWIFRDTGNEPLSSQRSGCNSSVGGHNSPKHETGKSQEKDREDQLNRLSQGPLSRRNQLSIYNLPHPSKLRCKEGKASKRSREAERDHPVQVHIHQLKKKRIAYFSSPSAATCPTDTVAFVAPPRVDVSLGISVHPPLSCQAVVAESSVTAVPGEEPEPAPVPVTDLPLTEEEDEHWFKKRWQSQQPSRPYRTFEE